MQQPPRGWWRVVAVTYEQEPDGSWIPVVRHECYGRTQPEARAVYTAHLAADAFLRECTETGQFGASAGASFPCRTVLELEQIR